MRKAERLFRLTTLLRRGRVVRATDLARELRVSERTIYRDVQSLVLAGVPVEGEAGVGYVLRRGSELPPLMFSPDEARSLTLGARMVQAWGDPQLEESARSVLEKVRAVAPESLQRDLDDPTLMVPGFHVSRDVRAALGLARQAISEQRKMKLGYVRADGDQTQRTIWPLGLVYWGQTWSVGAWCELRRDFRSFRVDRMVFPKLMKGRYRTSKDISLEAFLRVVDRR